MTDNGISELVEMRYDISEGKYEVYNIIDVPEEVASFFDEVLRDR